jgi:hypothetical protein
MFISHSLRLLFVSIALLLAFCAYGRANFYRDPGSVLFYDPKRAYERKYSAVREKEVLKFRENALKLVQNGGELLGVGKDPTMCAVFVSSDRRVAGEDGIVPVEVRYIPYYGWDMERRMRSEMDFFLRGGFTINTSI